MVPHSHGSRPAILAHRPAPVQVNGWSAGYSTGTPYLDYILGDPLMLPFSDQPFFSEKIVHLPHTCFPYDSKQKIAARLPQRAEEGLPERGFVFCSFNNSYKITPKFFAVWMRLLREVPDSVIWLARNNDFTVANLRRAAEEAGIDPARLIFAEVRPAIEDHLARHQLADLVLDTLPYNAQTTAMDALWAGIPVLTCAGRSYAGRFATSQLHEIGVPELIAPDLAAYEQLAVALARDPQRLRQIRTTIENNRSTTPLFDTRRLCRELESAYTTMIDIWRRGEAPQSFSVDAS
jgi:predicted O-linked N-acetylglucosamine transferase (SPINDLY family)